MTQYSLNKLWNSTLIRKQNQEGLQHIYQDQRKSLVIELWDHHEENHLITVRSLWRKSSIGWLSEVHGHGFKGQNQLLIKEKYCFECLQPMKPQHNVKACDKRLNCRTCSSGHSTVIHGHVPKRKNDAQDDQRRTENDESVTNSFADFKTLSTVENHQTKVISMCIVRVEVKSAA